ncbi:MAG: 3-deoxy-manno-octulosonate cytidylyltransferase [Algoriphagus sp.]|uniref:3-deoxy-manno-octulosonate cytidylyltransferase n=1 Tax=Algoriphagus sp. TaxID=1872435 RepID=UPI002606ED35|nr:3-deoxy-manno-octulosonate cytidylyltransferase [Algoriphagus sp.]MDG1275674.1 3-deoxy-manno-octulosonate cytidylyltransferase [Algoriphagus sp.]
MKKIALIPARYASTRLPAKLVQDLGGKSVIQRTYLSTLATGVFDEVWVVTDHETIQTQIQDLGGNVFFSQKAHESGSDRIAEALSKIEGELVVNVQGDEPNQDTKALTDLVHAFQDESVSVATLMTRISAEEAQNPNFVKVVTDQAGNALYFSRAMIPYNRDGLPDVYYWKHIGVYAYRREALLAFTQLEKSSLERIEMLEQLRLLDNGYKIRMVETDHLPIAIDTAEDLANARTKIPKIS